MLRILAFSVQFAHFFKLVPYEWDGKCQLMRMSSATVHLKCWNCQVFLHVAHQLFLSVRLWQLISAHEASFTFYCIQFTYYLALALVLTFQLSIFVCTAEWILFMNRLILFSKQVDGKLVNV